MSETTEVKREYDKILEELKGKLNVHAKDYVPKLANALKKEDSEQSGTDIVDKIKKDCGYWHRDTIRKFLPKELKDEIKQEAGKKGAAKTNEMKQAEKNKEIPLLVDGTPAVDLPSGDPSLPDYNPAEKDSESSKEQDLGTSTNQPDKRYINQAVTLLEEAVQTRDKQIAELRTELAQTRVEDVKPDEPKESVVAPDDYVANLEAEVAELKKYRDITFGPFLFCKPGSNVYNDSRNLWKELLKAVHYVGYDLVPYEKDGELVPPKARGFNFGIVDGKFDGVFGVAVLGVKEQTH